MKDKNIDILLNQIAEYLYKLQSNRGFPFNYLSEHEKDRWKKKAIEILSIIKESEWFDKFLEKTIEEVVKNNFCHINKNNNIIKIKEE